ncbi:MAG: hypothetical protein L6R39_005886, partial [Caloplaca ligustica]
MSSQGGQREEKAFFCHQCENEWRETVNNLKCPQCESEFVEVVRRMPTANPCYRVLIPPPQLEDDDDPREERHANDDAETHPDRLPLHPLHTMNPWADRPGSADGNLEHVEWTPAPGLHFSRTSYRSSSPRGGLPNQPGNDPVASIFQSMFETLPGGPRPNNPFPAPPSAPPQQAPWQQPNPHFSGPYRPQPSYYGGRNTYTSTTRVWPTPPSPTNTGNNHLQDVMRALFENLSQVPGPDGPQNNNHNGNPRGGGPTRTATFTGGFPGLHQLFASVLNPANAAHGDV